MGKRNRMTDIMEIVMKKDPHEREFHQAVGEVITLRWNRRLDSWEQPHLL